MKKINKLRTLLFASLGSLSIAFGVLITPKQNFEQVDAAKKTTIEVKDGFVEIGSYPQTIVKYSDDLFTSIKASSHVGDLYTYENNQYTYMGLTTHYPEGGGKYADGSPVQSNIEAFFKWEPIKWHVLYTDTDQNVAFLFAKEILEVWQYQPLVDKTTWYILETTTYATDWERSSIRDLLNGQFYESAFSGTEQGYIKEFVNKADKNASNKDVNDRVSLISPSTFNEFKKSKNIKGGASDYAKAHNLAYHFHDYDSGSFFWLNAKKDNVSIRYIDYVRGTEVNGGGFSEDTTSNGLGARPIIALDLSKVALGGTEEQSAKKAKNSGTIKLIIGILFTLFGMAGVITFLTLWSKGKLGKMNVKAIISIVAASMVVTSTGLVCLTSYSKKGGGGGGLGGCTFKTGYYLQSTAKYEDSNANFVQVGLSCYLFRSDGTVSYCASVDTEDASDFVGDSGSGTWTKSGCTLKFTYNTPMGSVAPTMTISGTKLLYNGAEVYHWVRGE